MIKCEGSHRPAAAGSVRGGVWQTGYCGVCRQRVAVDGRGKLLVHTRDLGAAR